MFITEGNEENEEPLFPLVASVKKQILKDSGFPFASLHVFRGPNADAF
jgi:hypothetical protein